jgi:ABC-type phosphate/phosphonate transport system ATPase subunit
MSLLDEKVDRLENHFKIYKSDMNDVKDSIKDLKIAIVGNDVNGNKGFLHLLNEIDKKVDGMKEKQLVMDENMNNVRFVAKALITGTIGFFVWLFQK